MRIRRPESPVLAKLVDIVRCVEPRLEVTADPDAPEVTLPPEPDVADPLDRLAVRARAVVEALGIDPGDSPLLRPVRDDERHVRAGHATSIAEARGWLEEIVAAARPADVPESFLASYVTRLAPAMLPLSAMTAHFLAEQKLGGKSFEERRRFFDFVERRCSDQRYARIQHGLLNYRALYLLSFSPAAPGAADFIHGEKYLYLPLWANSKFTIAPSLQLHTRPRRTVLDLGAGPGHFALVCEYLGHAYHGIDIPYPAKTPFSEHDIYEQTFDGFGLHRSLQYISAFTPLQVSRRFQLVTCLMGVFCTHQTPDGPVAWQWPEWQFFLRDLVQNVVTPEFEIHLHIARPFLAPEVVDAMQARGVAVHLERNTARLTHAQAAAMTAAGT